MPSVTQEWVQKLTFMQQTVLITATRGPDGLHKDHVSKLLLRWLRRCFLVSAMDGKVLDTPRTPGGGSFMGPSLGPHTVNKKYQWEIDMWRVFGKYVKSLDEVPHHFQLHFMHAAEILGYKHPSISIRQFWNHVYQSLVKDMHLSSESEEMMDFRLGDSENAWRSCENFPATNPGEHEL